MDKIKKIIIWIVVLVLLSVSLVTVIGISKNSSLMKNSGYGIGNNMDGGMALDVETMINDGDSFVAEGPAERSMMSAELDTNQDGADKKVIKTGSLNLKVNDVDIASEKISQIAKNNDGEVFSSNFSQSSKNIKSGTVEVKVPMNNFDKAFSEIKTVATLVVRESTSGTDVTMEYADLQIQLKNKQAEEQSFLSILDRAGKIDDVLSVTREIARVRSEIERLQGRIKFMDSQTDKSTISVSITEDTAITFSDKWRPWQVAKETFNALFKDIQNVINFAIVLVIRIIPVIILYVVIFGLLYWVGRKIYFRIRR